MGSSLFFLSLNDLMLFKARCYRNDVIVLLMVIN
jgi:hypothetical protein